MYSLVALVVNNTTFSSKCAFRHVCATCKRKGHKAKECEETPIDSQYKVSQAISARASRGQGGGTNQPSNP